MSEKIISGVLMDETVEITLRELCYACSQSAEWVDELIAEGVLEPTRGNFDRRRFSASNLERAQAAARLQRDLGVNIAGVALALDLLDEVKTLRARLVQLGIQEVR